MIHFGLPELCISNSLFARVNSFDELLVYVEVLYNIVISQFSTNCDIFVARNMKYDCTTNSCVNYFDKHFQGSQPVTINI